MNIKQNEFLSKVQNNNINSEVIIIKELIIPDLNTITYLSDLIPDSNEEKRKIIKCQYVTIRNKEYIEITFEDNEIILARYKNKTKRWIVLYFTQEDDSENIQKIKDFVRNYL